METRWTIKPKPLQETVNLLQKEVTLPETLAIILAQRGINNFREAKNFFRPDLNQLHDPFLMVDMDKAVQRITEAIKKEEKILVYGDYDVDGTTSVALMVSYLKNYYDKVDYYLPDRYKEGYGISQEGVLFAKENDFKLIIALDCGIKAIEKVDLASSFGIDFIICDHHNPGEEIPKAVAVLDPKRKDCPYPFNELSGCGVGFKLAQALSIAWEKDIQIVYDLLDLVCVSIAADIVPIVDENRILAYHGLKKINSKPRVGLKMLNQNKAGDPLTISKIVFTVGPKINAAGRINHAKNAVQLLLTENEVNARLFKAKIIEFNETRRKLDADITASALQQLEEETEEKASTVVYDPSWHKGVIGIVASRLIEKYYRPTVVLTNGDKGDLVASVRSVKGFDVYKAIEACAPLLDRYGGHKYAAGLSMPKVNLPEFSRRFELVVRDQITKIQQSRSIDVDCELNFNEITPKFINVLRQMQPFGPKNLAPVFLTKNVQTAGTEKLMGKKEEHLKLDIFQPDYRQVFTAVGFGFGKDLSKFKKYPFDMVYSISENHWQGKKHVQFLIKDVRFHN